MLLIPLVLAVVGGAMIVVLVVSGLMVNRRNERSEVRHRIERQQRLRARLRAPVEHRAHLPFGSAAGALDAMEDLRHRCGV